MTIPFRLLKSGAQEHPRKEGPLIWVDIVSGLPSSGDRAGSIPLSGTVAPSMCIIDFLMRYQLFDSTVRRMP